jgi:hypothetical protein
MLQVVNKIHDGAVSASSMSGNRLLDPRNFVALHRSICSNVIGSKGGHDQRHRTALFSSAALLQFQKTFGQSGRNGRPRTEAYTTKQDQEKHRGGKKRKREKKKKKKKKKTIANKYKPSSLTHLAQLKFLNFDPSNRRFFVWFVFLFFFSKCLVSQWDSTFHFNWYTN